jgi:hypothetical protein
MQFGAGYGLELNHRFRGLFQQWLSWRLLYTFRHKSYTLRKDLLAPMEDYMFTRTSHKVTAAVTAGLLALSLSACGGGTEADTTTAAEGEALVNTVEEAAQATGAFDTAVVTPDKNSFTMSSPAKFTPGKFAAGQLPGQVNQRFNITISNGSGAELDLATLIIKGTTTAGACVDIFDGDAKMDGAPQTPLAAGASISFAWGISCPGAPGDELTVVLTNNAVNVVEAKGKLA